MVGVWANASQRDECPAADAKSPLRMRWHEAPHSAAIIK